MSIDNRPALKNIFERIVNPLNANTCFDHFSINKQDRLIAAWEEDATEAEQEDLYEMALAELEHAQYLVMMAGLLKGHATREHIAASAELREAYATVVGEQVWRIHELYVNSHPLSKADDLRKAS